MVHYVCENRFKGCSVLVTGAGSGIGQACAVRFAQEGAAVAICDIEKSMLDETKAKVEMHGTDSMVAVFDISKKQEVERAVDSVIDRFGKLSVLVNSAGIILENDFMSIGQEEWLKHIDVNLNGAFYITQAVLKNMMTNRSGKIIHITSKSGLIGRPRRVHYSASKFGMNGLTQALALEVAGHGITVNAICPSRIESGMTKSILERRARSQGRSYEEVKEEYVQSVPVGRLGLPDDVASLVLFLASEDASYITGQFISVSGGR